MADLPLATTLAVDVPSTPITSDNPVFSDEPFNASSPPSSPPEFPWENTATTKYNTPSRPSRLSKPITSAFSLLGKRKALTPINDNGRSAKKPTPAAKKDSKTQMQISIGQEVQKRCKTCGMEYIASSDEDRKLHDKYHKQHSEGYDVGKDFLCKGRVGSVFEPSKGAAIAAVDGLDNVWRRKRATAALDVVQRELGAVEIKHLWERLPQDENISRHTAYLYVRQSKCVGFLLVEQITEGMKALEPAKRPRAEDTPAKAKISALERLRARHASQQEDEEEAAAQPIRISTKSSPASLGVSRIWTSPSHRGQGIAQCLLDQALAHQNERGSRGNDTENFTKNDVAFSQPTEAGAKLARKWMGKKYGWLVYVD